MIWICKYVKTLFKVDAVRGVKFDALPEVLSLHLLRFTFDLERMRRVKVLLRRKKRMRRY